MRDAGFVGVQIEEKAESGEFISQWMPGSGAEKYVTAAYVIGTKPVPGPLVAYGAVTRLVPGLAALAEALGKALVPRFLGMPFPAFLTRRGLFGGTPSLTFCSRAVGSSLQPPAAPTPKPMGVSSLASQVPAFKLKPKASASC
mmetsp:Transcript_26197/g.70799  ORF Transcript_26197/g.70799 Transcript_26197/m.70799 type:complete len:143 (+) Transcript_26197:733-1161(+)